MSEARRVLITGTRKGIGRHLAEHFLKQGDDVIGCSRSEADIDSPHYRHFALDVADEPAVKTMFRAIRQELGSLDCLINNAGIAGMNHAVLTPISAVKRILDTNVVGCFLFCREAAKIMKKVRSGRIVNFSTVAVPLQLEGEAVYAASKAAVVSLTQILGREFAPFGITVNAIGPTPIETDLISAVPPDRIERLLERQAVQRMGQFEDVVNVVDFFLRPQSDFITGQVLYLGGIS